MGKTLRNFTETPPGMWRYRVPETGVEIKDYYSCNDIEVAVAAHYRANHMPTPTGLRQLIINQMCEHLPDGWCKDPDNPLDELASMPNEFRRVLQGTATIVDWFLAGREKVDAAEAASRAETCSTCDFNRQVTGCTTCNAGSLRRLVNRVVNGDSTVFDGKLHACQICGCELKAKIWIPLDVLKRHMSKAQQLQFPPPHDGFKGCWLRS